MQTVIVCTAQHFQVKESEIRGKRRFEQIVKARQVAMHACKAVAGVSQPVTGRFFGKDPATVCHALRVVEGDHALRVDSEHVQARARLIAGAE